MAKKAYEVTLVLFVDDEEYDHPDEWSWPDILDMDYEDVIIENVRDIQQ